MNTQKRKNKDIIIEREKLFIPEITKLYSDGKTKIARLGVGTAGVVYRVTTDEVVKVMLSERYYNQIRWYKLTLARLQKIMNGNQHMEPYHNFYMHSHFDFSERVGKDGRPMFIYEKMQYMPMDLDTYAKEHDWTVDDFINIMCQVMHGMRLFHALHYILTDLKLLNVLYNPVTKQLKLIDFFESYNTRDQTSKFMYTYYNRNNGFTKKEDVWRLGIFMIEFIYQRIKRINEKNHAPKMPRFLTDMKTAVCAKPAHRYSYHTMIAPYLSQMQSVLLEHTRATEHKQWNQIFKLIPKLVDEQPRKRLDIRHILAGRVFCDTCFIPRVSYQEGSPPESRAVKHHARHKYLHSSSNSQKSSTRLHGSRDTHTQKSSTNEADVSNTSSSHPLTSSSSSTPTTTAVKTTFSSSRDVSTRNSTSSKHSSSLSSDNENQKTKKKKRKRARENKT